MAGLDPNQRFETLVFVKVGDRQTAQGLKPVYKQLGWKYVEYDGNPNRFVEPISIPNAAVLLNQNDAFSGNVIGWEVVEGRALTGFSLGEPIDVRGPSGAS